MFKDFADFALKEFGYTVRQSEEKEPESFKDIFGFSCEEEEEENETNQKSLS